MRQADERGQQVELLEDEPDPPVADVGQLLLGHGAHVLAGQPEGARRRDVEAAEDVHEGRLARARRAHDGHVLAGVDGRSDTPRRASTSSVPVAVGLPDILTSMTGGVTAGMLPGVVRPRPRPVSSTTTAVGRSSAIRSSASSAEPTAAAAEPAAAATAAEPTATAAAAEATAAPAERLRPVPVHQTPGR